MNLPSWLPIVFSGFSVLLSVCAFGHTVYRSWRDNNPQVKATSRFFEASEYNPEDSIQLRIVNSGRKPVIIRMLGVQLAAGTSSWFGTYLGDHEHGHRLGESEWWEKTLSKHDDLFIGPDVVEDPIDLWFEDSLGKRYAVKNAAKNLARLYGKK